MHLPAQTVLFWATLTTALLDKPALWKDLSKFTQPLADGLPRQGQVISAWPSGTLSKLCWDNIVRDKLDPGTFQTYSVSFNDCSQAWTFCYQIGSYQSIDEFASIFSQAPVRMRMWVSDVSLYKDGGGGYQFGTTITLKGTPMADTMIHESEHAHETITDKDGRQATTEWLSAYAADSAVQSEYGRNNQIENLAQTPGMIIYDRLTNGKLGQEPDLWKIGNALNTFVDQADNSKYGGRMLDIDGVYCTRRYVPSAKVKTDGTSVSTAQSLFIESLQTSRGIGIAAEDIIMEAIPPLTQSAPTNCTF
ncbi:hypothetical protein TruAng_006319 [Truncatella angustata]|nr:hypothetical protein TruAng_006319 [Truncatella angustata]